MTPKRKDEWEGFGEDLDKVVEDEFAGHNLVFGGVLIDHAERRRRLSWFAHTKDRLIEESSDPEAAKEVYKPFGLRYPDRLYRLVLFKRSLITRGLLPADCDIPTEMPPADEKMMRHPGAEDKMMRAKLEDK